MTPKEMAGWIFLGIMLTLMVVDTVHVIYVAFTNEDDVDEGTPSD